MPTRDGSARNRRSVVRGFSVRVSASAASFASGFRFRAARLYEGNRSADDDGGTICLTLAA
jgi:hypothetical protein